jgi:hypothetical protein
MGKTFGSGMADRPETSKAPAPEEIMGRNTAVTLFSVLMLAVAGCSAGGETYLDSQRGTEPKTAAPASELGRFLSAFGPGGGDPDFEPLELYWSVNSGVNDIPVSKIRLQSANAGIEIVDLPPEDPQPFHTYLHLASEADGLEFALYAFKDVPAGHYIKSVQVRGEAGSFMLGTANFERKAFDWHGSFGLGALLPDPHDNNSVTQILDPRPNRNSAGWAYLVLASTDGQQPHIDELKVEFAAAPAQPGTL